MTAAEIAAFNSGVRAVLHLAKQTAETMDARVKEKPTRFNFAAEALHGLAEEGISLLMDQALPDQTHEISGNSQQR